MHLVGDGLSVQQNILPRIASGSNEVFLLSRWGIWAAVSVGLVDGRVLLDLSYEEDYRAEVDFNIVMTDQREFVEVQGTTEEGAFSKSALDEVLAMAENGITKLLALQKEVGRSP